jgi:hypothetical protein
MSAAFLLFYQGLLVIVVGDSALNPHQQELSYHTYPQCPANPEPSK